MDYSGTSITPTPTPPVEPTPESVLMNLASTAAKNSPFVVYYSYAILAVVAIVIVITAALVLSASLKSSGNRPMHLKINNSSKGKFFNHISSRWPKEKGQDTGADLSNMSYNPRDVQDFETESEDLLSENMEFDTSMTQIVQVEVHEYASNDETAAGCTPLPSPQIHSIITLEDCT